MTRRLTLLALAVAAAIPGTALAGPIADPAHPELSARVAQLDSPSLSSAAPAVQAAAVHLSATGAGSLQHVGDGIVVEIRFASGAADARTALEAAGARILHVSTTYQTVSAAVDPADFAKVSNVPGVRSVVEALAPAVGGTGPGTDDGDGFITGACPQGAATSEGDAKLQANSLRSVLGVDGSGQKVGLISDSFNRLGGAPGDVSSGDLPGTTNPCGHTTPVNLVDEGPVTGTDEGRAMAQIVHDLAPGASLAFASSSTTQTGMADNIRALKNAGATVISDDITYFAEPFFQKGPIENAVDEVNAAGVSFFSDAANNNIISGGKDVASWETPAYRDTACPPGSPVIYTSCENFNPGSGAADPTFGVTTTPSTNNVRAAMQWAEPWNGVNTDFDILVFEANGTFDFATSTRNPGAAGSQQPFEFLNINTGSATTGLQFAIARFSGAPNTPRLKLAFLRNGVQSTFPNEYTQSVGGDIVGPTIFGHNGAENGSSVAATDEAVLDAPEVYSSRGPVTHYFGPVSGTTPAAPLVAPQVLAKPDITATDCTSNTFFGSGNKFCGTSAASPHAAAVAALMRQSDPTLTPASVRALQAANAVPVGAFGPSAVGAGLVSATGAAPRPRVQLTGPPSFTNIPTPVFTFSANRAVTFACTVDGGAAQACSSPFSTASLPDGAHTVAVTATDALGHSGAGSSSFTVDTVAPAVALTTGPTTGTRDRQPTFGFSSNEPASFLCHFDGAPAGPCSAAAADRSATALADGPHSFEVVGIDAAGNSAPAARSFTVDTTPPPATITSAPGRFTRQSHPAFGFKSSEAGVTFLCRFDTAAAGPCSSAKSHRPKSALRNGKHTFEVVAVDSAGSGPGARRTFTVDTKKPKAKIKKHPPKSTGARRARFTGSSSEKGVKFQCKLDRKKFKKCTSRKTLTVTPGRHTFQLRAVDRAGNVGKPATFRWLVTG